MRRRGGGSGEARETAHLRGLNLERVLEFGIAREGVFTRGEVAAATGLSAPTVSALSVDLVRRGLFLDRGAGPSSGGRRPTHLEFNARHGVVVGIDLGPTRTRLALADLRGVPLGHCEIRTAPRRGPTAVLADVVSGVGALLDEARVARRRVLSVCAGVPGVVDRERGRVVALAPNLAGWPGLAVGEKLSAALGAPVVVENDVNLAVLGERWRGAARGHETCAYVLLGTGVGAGIVVDGHLHRGHGFLAGEIALMCMGPEYAERDFGAHGCLESLVGLGALRRRWRSLGGATRRGWVPELFGAAAEGHPGARQLVDETATLVAIAVANLSVVLDPSLVVLAGGLVAQAPSLVDDVRRRVARLVPSAGAIAPSELGEEAPLYGSLLIASGQAQEALRRGVRGH